MTRFWIRYLFFLFLPIISEAESINCRDVHEGIYKSHGLYGSLCTIVRSNNKQTETWGKPVTIIQYDIDWISECTYIMYNQQIIKGFDSTFLMSRFDTLYNEITEVNNYWQKITSSLNNCEPPTHVNYFNVDTINLYKDLGDIEKLKDYKGSTGGGTFVGYNYAVTYKQHSTDTNKYAFAFLEAVNINEKSKFKLLDNLFYTMDECQKITISNCRYNEEYDKEIVAIYTSDNPKQEAGIIKAWRFNKLKLRIEEVDREKVKYREADKRLFFWSD